MIKLLIGSIVLLAIGVLLYGLWQEKKKVEANKELRSELDDVQADLRQTNAEDEVVDAKIQLKTRQEEVAAKAKEAGIKKKRKTDSDK